MSDRFDYQQQLAEQEEREREERWAEALAMNAALDAHRKWKEQFFAQKETTDAPAH